MHAGFSHSEAESEVATHLRRVRAALARRRDVLLAGFLAGAVLGLALSIAGFDLSFFLLDALGTSANPDNASREAPVEPGLGPSLDLLPWLLATVMVLGLAGAAGALVARNHWRRAGALDTFFDLAPRRVYLLQAAAVWLGMTALIVAIVRAQAGSHIGAGAMEMLAFFGIPILAGVFGFGFPVVYNRLLPRTSSLSAAAYARPIIEREAARQIKPQRTLYPRTHMSRTADRRSRWSDETLADKPRGYFTDAQRRRATARDGTRWPGTDGHHVPPRQRFARYLLLAGGVTAAAALLIYRIAWHARYGRPSEETGAIALFLGAVLGVSLTWLYTRYFEPLDHTLTRRLTVYVVLTTVVTLVVWRLMHWLVWASSDEALRGRSPSDIYLPPWADNFGLVLGLLLGVTLTWAYARYFESL